MRSGPIQLNNEILWEDLGNGVQRQLFGFDETVMMVKVKFEKGAIGELHSHFHTQVSYVESGTFEMVIGDLTKIIKRGDGFYVEPNILHGTTCIEAGVLIDVFAPLREDFLPVKIGVAEI
jgi:quercetin dioxygenase-like cupin family protein